MDECARPPVRLRHAGAGRGVAAQRRVWQREAAARRRARSRAHARAAFGCAAWGQAWQPGAGRDVWLGVARGPPWGAHCFSMALRKLLPTERTTLCRLSGRWRGATQKKPVNGSLAEGGPPEGCGLERGGADS